MDNRYIGVFDSGLGGLTAVKEIMKELPNENIVYFGDTGRVPYGTRSEETIMKYVRDDIRFLQSFDVKMIVIACGTASSVALPAIKEECPVPIVGVVDATAYQAVRVTKNKKIGVIGTPGTIKSNSYVKLIQAHDSSIQIYKQACPLFVPIVENGHFNTPVTKLLVEEYLSDIRDAGVDTLILGCTHYPLLKDAIREYMGDSVALIDPGEEVVKYLKKKFNEDDICNSTPGENQYVYYVSDNKEGFAELGGIFLGQKINGQVNKIDIEHFRG